MRQGVTGRHVGYCRGEGGGAKVDVIEGLPFSGLYPNPNTGILSVNPFTRFESVSTIGYETDFMMPILIQKMSPPVLGRESCQTQHLNTLSHKVYVIPRR